MRCNGPLNPSRVLIACLLSGVVGCTPPLSFALDQAEVQPIEIMPLAPLVVPSDASAIRLFTANIPTRRRGAALAQGGRGHVIGWPPAQARPQMDTWEQTDNCEIRSRQQVQALPHQGPIPVCGATCQGSRTVQALPHQGPIPVKPDAQSLVDQVWTRYCNGGDAMTDTDYEIISQRHDVIPDRYKPTCRPPK